LPTTAQRKSGLPSVSRSLQVLALGVLVLIVGATAQQLLQIRSAILDNTERQMARLDMVFAEQTGRAVETIDFILRAGIDALQAQRVNDHPETAIVERQILRRMEGVRQVRRVAFADATGRIILSEPPVGIQELPTAGKNLFAKFAATTDAGLLISEPFQTPDGTWTALLGRAIRHPDSGAFEGAAFAWINLAYFEDFYRAVELNENGAIILHHRDGTVLARYPHSDKAMGSSFADLPPFRDVLSHSMAGTVLMESPIDGSIRVLAIRALKAFPLAVQVSVDESRVLEDWRRQAFIFTLLAVGASAVIVTQLLLLAQRSHEVEVLAGEFRAASEVAQQANSALREQMSERERAEAALRQAQRIEAVGQLTGGVAHDFNNLLTVILGNLDLVEATEGRDPRTPERLVAMRGAAERGARLTGQLLAFARRQPLAARPVDLNGVVTGMDGLLRSALGANVRLRNRLADNLWPALVDPTQIELVILNLAINARDAMPAGGDIEIETGNVHLGAPKRAEEAAAGDYVMVRVSDTGTGMTPEVLTKAFEPFFTTKPVGAGSGLGLSQVFGTARQSGGDVTIESEPGRGTTVTLHLPRAPVDAAPAPPAPGAPDAAGADSRLVLLVDDDAAVRRTTAELLRAQGFTVKEADGGRAALDCLQQEPDISVLVTDVVMPDINGVVLAETAREMRPRLAVVYMSGYADLAGLTGGAAIGRLVRKPFRPSELTEQIVEALSEMRAEAT
jgi:signal transduction histidine kinase/ActR/RegA family two-component response regulator